MSIEIKGLLLGIIVSLGLLGVTFGLMRNSKQTQLLSAQRMSWRGKPNEVTACLTIAALLATEMMHVGTKGPASTTSPRAMPELQPSSKGASKVKCLPLPKNSVTRMFRR